MKELVDYIMSVNALNKNVKVTLDINADDFSVHIKKGYNSVFSVYNLPHERASKMIAHIDMELKDIAE